MNNDFSVKDIAGTIGYLIVDWWCKFLFNCSKLSLMIEYWYNCSLWFDMNWFRKWSMVWQSTTGYASIFPEMFKIVLHVDFVMNLLKCVVYLAWYVHTTYLLPAPQLLFWQIIHLCIFWNEWSVQLKCIQAFNSEPVLPPYSARPDLVDKVLKTRYNEAKAKLRKDLDLLIVILPDNNGSLYGNDGLHYIFQYFIFL